ncbi:XrtA-associated tyrosine autokinase [Nitrosomonas eutropha]|uniref:XrtA-associated tyrosine autokinase n=1 Tax=Nitrosomonas eutropha TaxID=916 RepID=UPI0008C904EC|nr:XrtA-associated tyrosine autokinase [Nitrosomonas eutropha]SEI64472.1 exopolysaccharide/PEP-CTERM locus tyrosine autokinase [Nitrosomonas eutropha]
MSLIERAADKLSKNEISNSIPGKIPQTVKTGLDPLFLSDNMSDQKIGKEVSVNNSPVVDLANRASTNKKTIKKIEIDLESLHRKGIVTLDHSRSEIAEQFRLIKRPLIANAFNPDSGIKNGNLIMVTSSLSGEGKSFCSINLAMSIAMEMDHRVLLVDADVARPSIPASLGFSPEEPGLLDLLRDPQWKISDVMMKTNVKKLTLIPAGRRHTHATELLASQSMHSILAELAQRYHDRVVIFDSPPLLLTSEARVLAGQMGQIVLVVEAERTTQQTVKEALLQIEACDVINLIYNKARAHSGGGYYGYGYY